MGKGNVTGPFKVRTSFAALKKAFEKQKQEGNVAQQCQAQHALEIFARNPQLERGFDSLLAFEENRQDVEALMSFLFPEVLKSNELKCALHPMSATSFYDSERLKNLKDEMIDTISLSSMTFSDKENAASANFLPYAIILNKYYGFDVDFTRPTTVELTLHDGSKRHYRAAYNGDFLHISPTEKAIEITPEILDELLLNTDNYEVWKKYFPNDSWLLEGFAILNLMDTSLDEQIDVFKEDLIASTVDAPFDVILEDIRQVLGIPNLTIGITQVKQNFLLRGNIPNMQSLFLWDQEQEDIEHLGCNSIRNRLLQDHKMVILPNVEAYNAGNVGNHLKKKLLGQGIKSAAFIPIVLEGEVVSLMEIGAFHKNQINAINIIKIEDILPFIYSFIKRSMVEFKNQINAIIQEECTSIHHAVKWKFEEEAYRFYITRQKNKHATFREVVFENVIPLYGQIDIAGSSEARNIALQNDLKQLLHESYSILEKISQTEPVPYYEQLLTETRQNLDLIQKTFHTQTEQYIANFFEMRLYPVLKYFSQVKQYAEDVKPFLSKLDENKSLYLSRKQYDATVDAINRELSQFLDDKQVEAQAIFPHYFQKYKTDGVEHDLYVGQSITQDALFNRNVLYHLRLWQLQIMCEMEARYYAMQEKYPINLKVASLIFAYDTPMSIRYRIDEKKFDVDGAYNVRYEMIKKRIDKAHIKNTNERLTQPHKLVIVYTNETMEREYMRYLQFLQIKGYVGEDLELLEVEDLQGAVGLKAIRAEININLEEAEKVYALEDVKQWVGRLHRY